jgi:hypothetical protein
MMRCPSALQEHQHGHEEHAARAGRKDQQPRWTVADVLDGE